MWKATWWRMLWIAILACGVVDSFADDPKPGAATSDPVATAALPMDFAPPGARSMGMALAFTAIADDATAAEANPAGLASLGAPELSVHFRASSYDTPILFPNAEQAAASANFFRAQDPFDLPLLAAEPQTSLDESMTSPSFVSVVYPFKRWVLSAYGSESRNIEGSNEFILDDPFFYDTYRAFRSIDTAIRNVGLAAAVKINDRVSVGVSLRQTTFEMAAFEEYQIDYLGDFEFANMTFDHVDTRIDRSLIDDDDTDITFNLGILFTPSPITKIGLVYKEGGRYELDGRSVSAVCTDFPGEGSCDPTDPSTYVYDSDPAGDPFTLEIVVPDVIGLGVAWKPKERLTLAVDVQRLQYSKGQYLDAADFGEISLAQGGDTETTEAAAETLEPIEDIKRFHFGAQYEFPLKSGRLPFVIRGGVYTDEDYDGSSAIDSNETHFAVGCGLLLGHLVMDFAAHLADSVDEMLLSLTYRF